LRPDHGRQDIDDQQHRASGWARCKIQTSMYGLAVRLMWGQPAVVGNLLWFGNFQRGGPRQHGKAGRQGRRWRARRQNTTYAYFAAAMMALGRGPIAGIASAWKGKERVLRAEHRRCRCRRWHTCRKPWWCLLAARVSVTLGGGTFGATPWA
jgi:hypothetical protein